MTDDVLASIAVITRTVLDLKRELARSPRCRAESINTHLAVYDPGHMPATVSMSLGVDTVGDGSYDLDIGITDRGETFDVLSFVARPHSDGATLVDVDRTGLTRAQLPDAARAVTDAIGHELRERVIGPV